MSWKPDIWIKRKDFDRIKNTLEEEHPTLNAWEFKIGHVKGVIIVSGEVTSAHDAVCDTLLEAGIEHWLLNGEPERCDKCHGWGEKLIDKDF